MEVSSQEEGGGEIPIPINSSTSNIIYGGGGVGHGGTTTNGHGHMNIHHHHIHQDHPHHPLLHHHIISPSSAPPQNPSNGSSMLQPPAAAGLEADHGPYNNNNNSSSSKKVVRYRECLKNHAAAMGGNATDGCGEFMPSGEEGTIEALNCSACHCHRNFHRKEVEGEPPCDYQQQYNFHRLGGSSSRKFILGHPHPHPHHNKNNILSPDQPLGYTAGNILPSRSVPPHGHHMIMPFNYNIGVSTSLPSESDEQEDAAAGIGGGGGGGVVATRPSTTQLVVKKRFRTKFTQEQKEKMLSFAEKVGWKIQKQEESLVQHFCQEIGVKRRVLKVWMHNNKHNLTKKNLPPPPPPPTATA